MGLPQVFRTLLVFLVLGSEGLFLKEVQTGCISLQSSGKMEDSEVSADLQPQWVDPFFERSPLKITTFMTSYSVLFSFSHASPAAWTTGSQADPAMWKPILFAKQLNSPPNPGSPPRRSEQLWILDPKSWKTDRRIWRGDTYPPGSRHKIGIFFG